MATYKEIQEFVKKKYGQSVKTCWIADMKENCGLPKRVANNRLNSYSKVNPCPEDKKLLIKEAFLHFEMIK